MFDLQELCQWDEAEKSVANDATSSADTQSIRTFQRVMARDDQVQCPFGYTSEVHDG